MIRDNLSGYGGGGVCGDAVLEGCTITGNRAWAYGAGGGVLGRPTIRNCVINDNQSGGPGGGVCAEGPCTITDTVLDGNVSGNGLDGYPGGGVWGKATLVRCQITNNTANHYDQGPSGPIDAVGTGVHGAVSLFQCTVAYNRIGNPPPVGVDPSGAVLGATNVENSILFGNDVADVASGTVTFSLVGTGWPGTGNITGDPLFVDALHGSFLLLPSSPAIDAGNPASPLDPDGSFADLGAYYGGLSAATALEHDGTGTNPWSLHSTSSPFLGSTWSATLDATLHDPSTFGAAIVGVLSPGAPLPTAFGELLIDPTATPVVLLASPTVGGVAAFQVAVPSSTALTGLWVYLQGFAAGTGIELANAIDLRLGF